MNAMHFFNRDSYLSSKLGRCFASRRCVYRVAWHCQPMGKVGAAEAEGMRAASYLSFVLVPKSPGAPGVSTERVELPLGLPRW